MGRLTNQAFNILQAELDACAVAEGPAGKALKPIVMKRLEKLRMQDGPLATLEELREAVKDMFPNFSDKVLREAVKANQPPGIFSTLTGIGAGLVGVAGILWVLNLPFPMIRWPVAKTMPILLLPSFLKMDYSYRQAIALVEQADQLVNKATSSADFELGDTKAKEAQKYLNALPVWFLGYYPQTYCSLFSCTWRFTVDEFEAARKNVGRMEAQIFQQKNAFNQLHQVEEALSAAKQAYQQAKTATERQQASTNWQATLDRLNQVPGETLAGAMAQKKLVAAQRDFQEAGGVATGSQKADNLIEAAKEFAMSAAVASQKPPHSAEKWEKIASLWGEAIDRLKFIPPDNPGYLDAQTKLAQYQQNMGTAQIRMQTERESVAAFNEAKTLLADLQAYSNKGESDRGEALKKLQVIINQLESVKSGTTVYAEAQKWLKSAKAKQSQWQG